MMRPPADNRLPLSLSALTSAHGSLHVLWLPALIFILGLAVSYITAALHYQSQFDRLREETHAKLEPIRGDLSRKVFAAVHLTEGIASLIYIEGEPSPQRFQALSAELLRRSDIIRNIAIAPNNIISQVYPLKGNEAALGLRYAENPSQWPSVQRMMTENRLVVAGPVSLVQGGIGVIARRPVRVLDSAGAGKMRYWGLVSTVIDFPKLIAQSTISSVSDSLRLGLRGVDGLGAEGKTFWGDESVFNDAPVVSNIPLPSGTWQIGAVPKQGWPVFNAFKSIYFQAGSLANALLTALIYRLLQVSNSRKIEIVQRINAETTLRRLNAEMNALNKLSQRVNQSISLKQVASAAVEGLLETTKTDTAFIFLREGERLILTSFGPLHQLERFGKIPEHRVGECICGLAVLEGRPMYSQNIFKDLRCTWEECKKAGYISFAALPLKIGDKVIGVAGLTSMEERNFEIQSEFLETLASQVSIAIQNAQLHNEVERHAVELEERVTQRTEELNVAMLKAQEADRLKSFFLATMSHELRTPLNSIIGFTGVLLQGLAGPLNAEQIKQLGMTLDSARHLLALINDVLDISKIEAGQLETERAPFDMRSAIENVIRIVSPQAQKKGLTLTAAIASDVGGIVSDRRRIEQILLNLLSNAIKFTEQGEVLLECSERDGWLEVKVRDTGIGIKPEDIKRLFKPFQQLETGLNRRHNGTGLGLAICRNLVHLLGGEIRVESEFGKGSSFIIALPMSPEGASHGKNSDN